MPRSTRSEIEREIEREVETGEFEAVPSDQLRPARLRRAWPGVGSRLGRPAPACAVSG